MEMFKFQYEPCSFRVSLHEKYSYTHLQQDLVRMWATMSDMSEQRLYLVLYYIYYIAIIFSRELINTVTRVLGKGYEIAYSGSHLQACRGKEGYQE